MKIFRGNVLKIAAVTAGVIVLYEISTQLLIYKYFRFDYYIAVAVVIAFFVGATLSRRRLQRPQESQNPFYLLTTKELCVLEMMAEGKSNKEIAYSNFVEMSTVKTHINKIFAKLEVKNRREAIYVYNNAIDTQKSTLFPPTSA